MPTKNVRHAYQTLTTDLMKRLIGRDHQHHPVTVVVDMDRSDSHNIRLICLPPVDAVAYALASDMGDQDRYILYRSRVLSNGEGEIACGRYRARILPPTSKK